MIIIKKKYVPRQVGGHEATDVFEWIKKHKKRGFEADFLIKSGQNRRVLYAIYDFHAVVYTIIIRNVDDF